MAIVAQHSHVERQLGTFSNTVSDLDGNVILKPTNFYENPFFADVDEDGDPDGIGVGMPAEPDGVWVYISDTDASADSLAAQNTNPIPLDQPSFVAAKSWIDGHRPQLTGMFSANISPPDAPVVQSVPSNRAGFENITYYCTYAYFDEQYRFTTVAPAVSVTPSLGQTLLFTIPSSLPERAVGVGIFMSVGGGNAFYLQKAIDQRFEITESWEHPGPFLFGRVAPSVNESIDYVPRESETESVRDSKGMKSSGKASTRSSKMGTTGTTKATKGTKKMIMSGVKQAIKLSPGKSKSNKKGKKTKANIKIFLIMQPTSGSSSQGAMSDSAKGSSSRGFAPGESVTTDGSSATGGGGGGGGKKKKRRKKRRGKKHEDEEPQEFDEEVTEPPTAPLDDVIPRGSAVMTPGTRLYALSYSVRGKESALSAPVEFTVTSGNMARVVIPDKFNAVTNPNLYERDSQGNPFDHNFAKGTGTGAISRATSDGYIQLSTAGLTHTTQTSPTHTLTFGVNRTQNYRVGVRVSVSSLIAGTVAVDLVEYDSSNAVIATTNLRTITGTGDVTVRSIQGPSGTAWNANTFSAAILTRFSGSSRNGEIFLSRFVANVGTIEPRPVLPPPAEYREPTTPNTSNFAPPPRASFKATGPPPATQKLATAKSLSEVNFDSGSIPSDWTLVNTNSAAITTAAASTAAKIDGNYGLALRKTTTATGLAYIWRSFATYDTDLALRFKCRINSLPNPNTNFGHGTTLASINRVVPTNGVWNAYPRLMSMFITDTGNLLALLQDNTGGAQVTLATNVFAGTLLDCEMRLRNVGSDLAYAEFYVGRNGAARTLAYTWFNLKYSGRQIAGVQVGSDYMGMPTQLWSLDFDSITVTEFGAPLDATSKPPPSEPIQLPDRPRLAPVNIDAEYDFESGAIHSNFVTSQLPATGTTLAVQAGSAITGTYGLRCQDTQTGTNAAVNIRRNLPTPREAFGARWRNRIVTRPNTGLITLGRIVNASSQDMARIYIDSSGDVYAQAYSAGVAQTATRIAAGQANGTILTFEIVVSGAGTIGGRASFYMQIGGDGLAANRNLYFQQQTLDWSSGLAGAALFGIVDETPAATTSTIDVDNILITELGEIVFSESFTDADGVQQTINQLYLHYLPGQEPDDTLGPGQRSFAVVPGEQYTFAIKARWQDVPTDQLAQPFFLTGVDLDGDTVEIGSPFGAGVSGSAAWTAVPQGDYSITFTCPEDVYQVDISSKGMGEGEWVFQEMAFSPGPTAVRPITYAPTGTYTVTLDTRAAVAEWKLDKLPFERKWEAIGATVQYFEDGGSYTLEMRSSNSTLGPWSDWTQVETQVPERRYVQFRVTLTANVALNESPILKYGNPWIEYFLMWEGNQVATLLDEDQQEFSGGCVIADFAVPYEMQPGLTRTLPNGRIKRMKFGSPVGKCPNFTVFAFTEEGARDIQERILDIEPWIQARDALYQVKFSEQLIFEPDDNEEWRREQTEDDDITWMFWGSADSGDEVDVLEELDLPRPLPSRFPQT